MFDSLFNLIIILIPLAIFIGRIVVQARGRHAPPPPSPRIPVHFEDEKEEEEFLPYTLSRGVPELRKVHKKQGALTPSLVAPTHGNAGSLPVIKAAISPKSPAKGNAEAASPPQKGFPLNLNNLSPLKQAVVMAEILGTPRGMM